MEALAARRDVIVEEWFVRTLAAYPDQTSRFLRSEKDPFRNPVGSTLREGLAVLVDELLAGMDAARVRAALDLIVRMRAVQDFDADQAVAFLSPLKEILRGRAAERDVAALEARLDEMALLASDLYVRCRERIREIQAGEARRRTYVAERVRLKRGNAP